MKRASALFVALGVFLMVDAVRGDEKPTTENPSGAAQSWWNVFAKQNGGTEEQRRLQQFWHDYYDSLRRYYKGLDHIDWVAYYRNHGYHLDGRHPACPSCSTPIGFAPLAISPSMPWAVPVVTPDISRRTKPAPK